MSSFSQKVQKGVVKFTSLKGVGALKDGMVLTMPITLVGSLFLLLQAIPIDGYEAFMAGIFGENWQAPLTQVSGATFDIIALVAVMGIAYSYAKSSKVDPISCAVLAFANFLILIPSSTTTLVEVNGVYVEQVVGGVVPKLWAGGQGMIGAILIGLSTGAIYVWCNKKGLKIKMPDGVPEGVSNAFSALIPGFIMMTLSALIYAIMLLLTGETLIEFIFTVLQIPLQNLTDTFFASIIIAFLVPFFWFFGIHGATLIGGVINPILQANALENQLILDQGVALVAGDNARIVTIQMVEIFTRMTGSGITIGLVVSAVLFAKAKQYKTLGKVALTPAIFNINEPVIFGFPIVLNPLLFVPFVLVPVIANIMIYVAIAIGFVQPFGAIMVPWTTPPIIAGFIIAGWQGAIMQLAIILMSIAVWYPFFLKADKIAYEKEQNAQEEDDDDEDW